MCSTAPTLAGKEIPKARLQLHASEIEAADFLLFYTGWEKYWGSEQYFSPFPVLSLEAAEYLAAFPLKGVGTDAISIDPMDTVDYPVHKILLGAGFVNTENLCNLASLVGKTFPYATLPLRFKNADGSPCAPSPCWRIELKKPLCRGQSGFLILYRRNAAKPPGLHRRLAVSEEKIQSPLSELFRSDVADGGDHAQP